MTSTIHLTELMAGDFTAADESSLFARRSTAKLFNPDQNGKVAEALMEKAKSGDLLAKKAACN
jgi:hypothetical protein